MAKSKGRKEVTKIPLDNEKVEVLVNGQWKRATFHEADYDEDEEAEEGESIWWTDCFALENGDTIPHLRSSDLPKWRRPPISTSRDIQQG